MITRREANIRLVATTAIAATSGLAWAQESLDLPQPRSEGGRPLIEALRLRRSIREYSTRPLMAQVLSDLLWAAFGINRPSSGDRTAPYWRHVMVIDIYVAMADGVWTYEPKAHGSLIYSVTSERLRDRTPLNLVYVATFMLVRMGQKLEDSHRAAKRIDYDLMHPEKWTAGMQPPHAIFWLISQSPIGCRFVTEFK